MRVCAGLLILSAGLTGQLAPPNDSGVSMGHLHFITPDPAAYRKLWVDVLGGKPVQVGPLEFALFPDVIVGWRKGENSGGTAGSVVTHLGFAVKDGAAIRARLAAAGAPVTRELPQTGQFFVMFPGGVEVEFTEDPGQSAPVRHHHIHFASHQVQEMRSWYAKVFRAVPGVRGKFQAADLPGANLSWNPAEKPPAPTKGRILDHIGFEVRDLAAFARRLEGAGVPLDMPVTPRPDLGLKIAFLTDPWGTRIELTEGLAALR